MTQYTHITFPRVSSSSLYAVIESGKAMKGLSLMPEPCRITILGVKSDRIEKSLEFVNLREARFQYSSEIKNSSPFLAVAMERGVFLA